jgi:hypothetical protein
MRYNMLLAATVMAIMLAGCASKYPLGMDEAEWLALSAEEKLDARKQQAEIDEARALRRAAEVQARAEERRRYEAFQSMARSTASPGSRVQCLLTGEVRAGGQWRDASPAWVDIVAGWRDEVAVTSRDGRFTHIGYAGFDGVTVRICPTELDLEWGAKRCAEVTATPQAYRRGLDREGLVEGVWRGQIQCDLPLDHH